MAFDVRTGLSCVFTVVWDLRPPVRKTRVGSGGKGLGETLADELASLKQRQP